MKRHIYNFRIRSLLIFYIFLCLFICSSFADNNTRPANELAASIQKAQISGMPEDWKAALRQAQSRKDTVAIGITYSSYIQSLANISPSSDLEQEAKEAFVFLYDTKQYVYYFALYNIYIDWMFANKSYSKAQDEATKMHLQATELNLPIGMAMALRVQGQIFYKLSLYDKAYKALSEGLEICPPYQDNLSNFATAQSICEWLFLVCVKIKEKDEIEAVSGKYNEILDYWLDKGWKDASGHCPVTAFSFQSIALLKSGDIKGAGACLDKARSYMRNDLPARAYEHYYEAAYMLSAEQKLYKEAIANIDTLLQMHRYYYPFYLKDLQVKAELLSLSGDAIQSANAYKEYIHGNDSLLRAEKIRQLDELMVQYQVEKTQQEAIQKTRSLYWAYAFISLISILLLSYALYARKLHTQNRLFVSQLEELDKLTNSLSSHVYKEDGGGGEQTLDGSDDEVLGQIEYYLREGHPFKDPSLNREKLAKVLQINERTISNVIKERKGMTVVEYINMARLDYSRRLLSSPESIALKEIAEESGFGTPRTFQRQFRDRYGMTPSQYRKIILEQEEKQMT